MDATSGPEPILNGLVQFVKVRALLPAQSTAATK